MYGLDGKVAVVTGSGRGIGRGIALGLAAAGARVIVNDFHPGAAEETAGDIRDLGGQAVANSTDVASFEGGQALIETAVNEFGRIDILVTCAGNFWPDMTLDVTEERWDAQLAVHATGTFACAQAASRHMLEQGDGGRIVTFSSRGAFFGPTPAYAAAKGAVMAMTSSLSAGLSSRGITVNCVLPSATTQLFPGEDSSARTFGGVAAANSLDPNDIAPLVVFLASSYGEGVTGQFMYAAGGDICVYPAPTSIGGSSTTYVRKLGRWEVDEIAEVLLPMLGVDSDGQAWSEEKVNSLSDAMFKGSSASA